MRPITRRFLIFLYGFVTAIPILSPINTRLIHNIPLGALALILILVLYIKVAPQIKFTGSFFRDNLVKWILIFIAVSFISFLFGVAKYRNVNGIVSLIFQGILLFHFAIGFIMLKTSDDIVMLFKGIIFMSVLTCLYIIISIYSVPFPSLAKEEGMLLSHAIFMPIIFGWPNAYGCFLIIALLCNMSLFSLASKTVARLLYGVSAVIVLSGIIITFSRTVYYAAVFSIMLYIIDQYKNFIRMTIIMSSFCFLVILGYSLFPEVLYIVFNISTFNVRLKLVYEVLRHDGIFGFLFGHGYQTFEVVTAKIANQEIVKGLSFSKLSTHNEYLTILLKSSVFGLCIFLWILFLLFMRSRRLSLKLVDPRERNIFIAWHAALLPLFLSLLTQENLRFWPIGITFWMISGSMLNFIINQAVERK